MTVQSITLNLPDELYQRLKQQAEKSHRSIEAELLAVVNTALPELDEELPPDLAELLNSLAYVDDATLWQIARNSVPKKASQKLASLNRKAQGEGLTEEEKQLSDKLIEQYDRAVLIRAEAALQLKRRGHDISYLLFHPHK